MFFHDHKHATSAPDVNLVASRNKGGKKAKQPL